ncbi:MAG TPA: NTP transferase domain-containing protein [Vicinamibacterales bacterium]|jgi:spore coat polysaccharide biosynthesis protein SpsF
MNLGGLPIILQARMGSSRLPGKVLADLVGRTVFAHCVARLQRAGVGPVVLATSDRPGDDPLVEAAECLGIRVVRGPEDDVLQRFALAADYLDARFFIRATADNPAVDIDAPARVGAAILAGGADRVVETGLPIGAAVEAVRVAALYQALAQTRGAYDREHVTPYIYRNPSRFLALAPEAPPALRRPDLRLTVDTADDLAFMRRVFERAAPAGETASLAEIIRSADAVGRPGQVA